jgi:hypothetical protein
MQSVLNASRVMKKWGELAGYGTAAPYSYIPVEYAECTKC